MAPKRNTRFRNLAAAGIAAGKLAYRGARKLADAMRSKPTSRPMSSPVGVSKKKSNKRNVIRGLGSGIATKSSYSSKSKPTKQVATIKLIGAPNINSTQASRTMQVDAGFQGYQTLAWADNDELYRLSAMQTTLQSTPIPRFVYNSLQGELLFTNATNMACEIEIYDIVAKRDINYEMNYRIPSSGAAFPWPQSTPVGAWEIGVSLGNNEGTLLSPRLSQYIGCSPYDSQVFKDYFTVKKRTLVQMPLGAVHRHTVNISPNKLISGSLYNNDLTYGWKGLTTWTMWVVKGYPVATTEGEATTASCEMLCVQSVRTKFNWVADATVTVYTQDNLTTPVETNQGFFNTASGLLDTVKTLSNDF